MKDKTLSLVAPEPKQALAVRDNEEISIGALLKGTLDKGITPENAATAEKLMDLYERMQDRGAKKDFVTALAEFQNEAKKIKATKPVPDKQGNIKYHFADFEAIMDEVQPMAQRHGFVISFSSKSDGRNLIKICRLQHSSGHSSDNEYGVRIGSGPPGASENQADGSAHTYAKRGALCDALNIRIDKNFDDSRNLGAKISKEDAASLRERVRATGSNEELFLKFAKAAAFEDINESMYDALDANLRKKERTA